MSRFRPSRWDVVWIVAFTVVVGYLLVQDPLSRDQVLGRNTEHTAEVVHVEPGRPDTCGRNRGEEWFVTVTWFAGQGGFARCDDESPYRIGESLRVWVQDGNETVATSSPADRRIVLGMLPLIPYLFVVVMPVLLVPMRSRIRERVASWRSPRRDDRPPDQM